MEQIVSSGIIDSYFEKLKSNLSVDVAIVGGGPSGIVYFFRRKPVRRWRCLIVSWLPVEVCGAAL